MKSMMNTRSSSKKKGVKKTSSSVETSHEATCLSVELPHALLCPICSKLSDRMIDITKKGRQNHKSFRQTNQRNRFQQRWSKNFINFSSMSQSRVQAHVRTCDYLSISPEIATCDECLDCRRCVNAVLKKV